MKQRWIILLSLITAVVTLVAAGWEPAFGQSAKATGSALALQVSPRTDDNGKVVKGQLILTATLTSADGKPITNQPITFYESVTFLGQPREALLGTATTDSTGVAGILYQPAQKGSNLILVRFAGSTAYQASQAQTNLDVDEVVSPFAVETVPLAAVGTGLTVAFAVLVVGAWAILLGVFLRTITGIRATARTAESAVAGKQLSSVLAKSRD